MTASRGAVRTEQGYEALYRAHHARIGSLCRLMLRNREEAEDASQEVFIILLREWESPVRPMAWGPWLTRVTVNTCRRRRRSRWWQWWQGATDAFDGDRLPAIGTAEDGAMSREQRARLVAAFDGLSARQREIFVLRHVEGWSTQDVADELGLSTGSVKRHLFRANRAFRSALGDRP